MRRVRPRRAGYALTRRTQRPSQTACSGAWREGAPPPRPAPPGGSSPPRSGCRLSRPPPPRRARLTPRPGRGAQPSLGGTRIRQRKRNITVPLDHASFADVVVGVFQDAAAEGAGAAEGGVEAALLAGVKALEVAGADLDYGRYGDTLFEARPAGAARRPRPQRRGRARVPACVLAADAFARPAPAPVPAPAAVYRRALRGRQHGG